MPHPSKETLMNQVPKSAAAVAESARWRQASGSIVAAAAFVGALVPSTSFAQVAPTSLPVQGSDWHYTATIYGYLPSVSGTSSFPADGSGTRLNLDASILDKLKVFAMATAGAHNGTWGVFTDVIYLKFQASQSASRDFTIGNVGLPADASAAFDWEMKGTAWTLAGEYRVASAPSFTVDVLAGTRLLDTRQHLRWNIAGSIGPLDPQSRSGEIATSQSTWDAIVGVKGRYAFGEDRKWSVPFYLDAGAGESQYTLQAAGGLAYQFGWGEITAMWRYLRYDLKSSSALQDVRFSGPLIGATFRW
jgi:hypothetical protein